jgi:hypothetical protein
MLRLRYLVLSLVTIVVVTARPAAADPGILLLAHGGADEWNQRVIDLAKTVDATQPTEVAFGMASRATIQAAVDKLVARGVTEIVAVPLFVSSWSSVITSTEYLLGLRDEAPADLAIFARMDHGHGGRHGAPAMVSHGSHAAHGAATEAAYVRHALAGADTGNAPHAAVDHAVHMAAGSSAQAQAAPIDGTTPVNVPVPVRMTPALNDHPVVADILASRARAISEPGAEEALVIVAHGPTKDEENRLWLADMESLAARLGEKENFASLQYLTVRDDAPKAIRDAATRELRSIVERETALGRRVLIVPLLISFGGIERGLRERLEGLEYTMADSGLIPDDRLAGWVLESARAKH